MKKRIAAIVLCVFCLLAIAGCSQSKPDAETAQPTAAQETGDYLTTISGTYEELFPQLAKAEYRDLWIDATTPLVGAENAETATDTLLAMCMAEPYGPEASEKYAADPESMAFNCYFRGGVDRFVMDGHTISGLDASCSTRATTRIPATLPTSPSPRTRWRRPIIWSSAMPRTSVTCRVGSRAIMPTGTPLRSPWTTIRRP